MSANTRKYSKTEKSRQYFTRIDDFDFVLLSNKTHKCNLCNKYLTAKNESNLFTHLRYCHKEIHDEIVSLANDENYFKKKRLKFIQNCVEITTINGRSILSLNDSGFQKLIEKDLNELNGAGFGVDFKRKVEIKNYIKSTANKITTKIKYETKNRFISLMVDVGSKNGRSFLGISIQYLFNGVVCIRCLGTVELKGSHTAAYIKNVTTTCLVSFDISSTQQIASITTDNGANMLAMIDMFNQDFCVDDDDHDEDDDDEDNSNEILWLNKLYVILGLVFV